MQHPSRGSWLPGTHIRKSERGIKFDFPSCRFLQGQDRAEVRPPPGSWGALWGQFQQHGTATLLTHKAAAATQDTPTRPEEKGGQLARGQFGSLGAELLGKEGGTEIGGGSPRGSSAVPSPPWCPRSCGNIPAIAPPPPLGFLPRALPSRSPPQAPEGHGGSSVPGNLGRCLELR